MYQTRNFSLHTTDSTTPNLLDGDDATSRVLESSSLVQKFQGTTLNEGSDAAAGTGTAYTMDIDDRFGGNLSTDADTDWVEITLEAGESYVFSVWGVNGSSVGMFDPALGLYNSSGTQIEFNEDVDFTNSNLFSMIEFTATTSGTYYLGVESNYGDSGDYILQATTNVLTPGQVATQTSEFGWGIPTVIHHDESTGDTMTVNIADLTSDGQQLATWALEAWGEVMGIDFQTSTSTGADIIFDDDQSGAFAGPSNFSSITGIISQSIVNVGSAWLDSYGTTYDSYSFLTYLHEIGHALGVTHTGNYDGFATYGISNFFENDSFQISVMSYFDIDEANLGDSAIAITPMIADVYAIWGLYGEPVSVNAGDTIWGANSNVSGTLGTLMGYLFDDDAVDADIYAGGPVALTITDTDGYDVVDLSTVDVDQLIDLREGGVSDVGGSDGNVVISLGTVIEEVIGGTGSDVIYGSDNDTVFNIGGGFANQIFGGAGNDTAIIDGNYADAAIFELGADSLIIDLSSTGGEYNGIETFVFNDGTYNYGELTGTSVAPVVGTPNDDLLIGTAGNDDIDGLGGNDRIEGGDGGDTLYGSDGSDGLLGQDGNDLMFGGDGNDRLPGAAGDDEIYGGAGNDNLGGGDGNDLMYGGAGNDRHGAGGGADTVYGGDGDDGIAGGAQQDLLYGGAGNDRVAGSFGSDETYGGAGNDKMGGGLGNDEIYGGIGDDTVGAGDGDDMIFGEEGEDLLNAGDGDDQIFGGGDNDRLNGGAGSDFMEGGAGNDTFVFTSPTSGEIDVVADFQSGFDTLALDRVGGNGDQAKFDNLNIAQDVNDTTIEWRGHTIVLLDYDANDLSAADFDFI